MTEPPATWFVYLLRCANGHYYTGVTNNLTRRLKQHQQGRGAKYTKINGPVQLVYWETAADRSSAQQREYQLRHHSHSKKADLVKSFPP